MSYRITRRTVLGAPFAFLAAGCFSGGAQQQGTGGQGQEPTGDPVPGGTYRLALPSDAPSLDPHKESSYNTHITVGAVYSKLVDFRTGPDLPYGSMELEGDLAEEWEVSDDGRTWTFHLRRGVRFHDVAPVSGREFTADDVLATVQRIQELPGQQLYLIDMVESVDAPDDYTVVFTLSAPFAAFDQNMADHFMWILPREGIEGDFDLERQAIGTGPFVLDDWQQDQERTYVKHPDYYAAPKPYLDGAHVTIVPDQHALIAAFRTGKVDTLTGLSSQEDQVRALAQEDPDVRIGEEQALTGVILYVNQDVEPFDDIRVRRALSMAVDYQSMAQSLRPGDKGGAPSAPVTPTLFGGLPEEEVLKLQPYDPEQAKQLLAEAGHPDGFSATMITTNGYGETVLREAQWVQQDLEKVGIQVEIDVQDYATYFTQSYAPQNYEMGFGLQTPFLSADTILSSVWLSDGSRNWYGIDDPELDQMIRDQRGILDEAEREQALLEISRYIIENVSNPLVLYTYITMAVYAPHVKNHHTHPDYGQRHWASVWLSEDAPGREG